MDQDCQGRATRLTASSSPKFIQTFSNSIISSTPWRRLVPGSAPLKIRRTPTVNLRHSQRSFKKPDPPDRFYGPGGNFQMARRHSAELIRKTQPRPDRTDHSTGRGSEIYSAPLRSLLVNVIISMPLPLVAHSLGRM